MSFASTSSSSGASVAMPVPRRGPCMLHLSLHAETLSASDVVAHLAKRHSDTPLPTDEATSLAASLGVARLTASHLELQDRGVAKVVQWLSERRETLPLWALESLRGTSGIEPLTSGHPVEKQHQVEPVRLRRLDLSANEVTSDGLTPIADYVHGNARLTSLELKGNEIGGSPELLRPLATALQFSLLRTLDLSSNPLGQESFIMLLDALHTPCLRELNLNLVLGNNTSPKQRRQAAAAVARLVRPRDVPLEGEGGWAPQLENLRLNGNDMGWRGVKDIVAAIIGATPDPRVSIRRPNHSLHHVELFATMADVPESDESDAEHTKHRGSRECDLAFNSEHRAVERTESVNNQDETISVAEAMLRTRVNVGGRTVNSDSSRANGQSICLPRVRPVKVSPRNTSSPQVLYAALERVHWRSVLGEQLWMNLERRSDVQRTARDILMCARVLGCSASTGPAARATPDVFAFGALPPELRLGIVRSLDSMGVLSDAQFLRIISWASSRSTLGWGSQSGTAASGTLRKPDANRDQPSLLPTHAWDWQASLTHSPPRDWEAAVADAPQPALGAGWGGGGGPRGDGGQGGYQFPPLLQPGLCAFWEATGTMVSDLP